MFVTAEIIEVTMREEPRAVVFRRNPFQSAPATVTVEIVGNDGEKINWLPVRLDELQAAVRALSC